MSAIDGPLVIDVSVGGHAGCRGRCCAATPAVAGDLVLVTGALGRAAAGLRLLLDGGDGLSEQEQCLGRRQLAAGRADRRGPPADRVGGALRR